MKYILTVVVFFWTTIAALASSDEISLDVYIMDPSKLGCPDTVDFKGCRSFNGTEDINEFLEKLKKDGIFPTRIKIDRNIKSSRNGPNGSFFGEVIDYGVDNHLGKKIIVKAAMMVFTAQNGSFVSGGFTRIDGSETYEPVSKRFGGNIRRYIHYGDLETLFHGLNVQFTIEKNGEKFPFRFVRS